MTVSMNEEFISLLDESIQLELQVAKLYRVFQSAFPRDEQFWWQLSLEEENHAALIRSEKEIYLPADFFPYDLVSQSLPELNETNAKLAQMIHTFQHTPPSREDAFRIAVELEEAAGEIHYQRFMDKKSQLNLDQIFQQLNYDDKDHARRIREYCDQQT